MIARYNNLSFVFALPGFALQIIGRMWLDSPEKSQFGLIMMLVGTGLVLLGFANYAKSRGRHPAWCLAAFLSVIGLVILAMLEDRTRDSSK